MVTMPRNKTQTRTAPPTALTSRDYPQMGTNAMRILVFIRDNPATSTNKIITGLEMNPTVVRKCLANLLNHQKIEDQVNKQGHHSYSIRKR